MNNSKAIDFFAWKHHYFEHLFPIWESLPPKYKGNFYVSTHIHELNRFSIPTIDDHFKISSNLQHIIHELSKQKNRLLVIPSMYGDFIDTINRPIALVSHGAGQTYKEKEYTLVPFRKNVILDILPNDHIGQVFKERYPNTTIEVVGCPKLDEWYRNFEPPQNPRPVISLSFHYDRNFVPETRTSFPHFKESLKCLAEEAEKKNWCVLGHGHPLMIETLIPYYEEYGFEVVKDFNEVMNRADLYICDHMSTLYEFASTGRPVVVLNAPWYRRRVEHGLRFWEFANVGINCDEPNQFISSIEKALEDPLEQKELRKKAVQGVYKYTDGRASVRASKALVKFVEANKVHLPSRRQTQVKGYSGINTLLKKQIDTSNSKIIIYGAGDHTTRLLNKLESINVIAVVDKDPSKVGTYIDEIPVHSKNMINQLGADVILISSQAYEEVIYEDLIKEFKDLKIYPLYKSNQSFEKEIFLEIYS
ncbi:CDP-glycerol glycerophosphotransferase family protein [Halalkalibacter sp. APA_J-10(15)]|uniref:CDP-glycerol glycerophosphotransferase family protein n=1 Tax=Halalkalibacter sp. APA_J-10(15) TaxID=2933805 RepID=UPI001FF3E103|nr:CDP-glycerol glycerophosphotransferase family protein [Halalkalibacter sp. APA_J-10(15)]MCK0472944.1 CDP-glycerol glycerophosphotransferase family protein [Halalkalibacter sp. APA_J-10(15)]